MPDKFVGACKDANEALSDRQRAWRLLALMQNDEPRLILLVGPYQESAILWGSFYASQGRTGIACHELTLAGLQLTPEVLLSNDCPALFVATLPTDDAEWVCKALSFVLMLAKQYPAIPIGCALSEKQYDLWVATPHPDCVSEHDRALLMRGFVKVDLFAPHFNEPLAALHQEAFEEWHANARKPAPRLLAPYRDETTPSPKAHSKAEFFLWSYLQSQPMTKDLFVLNQRLPLTFGNRPIEIDLYAQSLRLAIEVDGHYHFTDLAAYRRDRRKDLLYQQQHLLILRFLAEDVLYSTTEVAATINSVVAALTMGNQKGNR
jgi:very-short-patch-repair endonuclease